MRAVTVAQISDGTGADRFGLKAGEQRRGRRPVQAAARQPVRSCTARRPRSADLQSASAGNPMNISAPFIHRPIATALLMVGLLLCGLVAYPLLPVARAAERQLPDHSGHGAIARRRSADHGVVGGDAARAAVRPDPRRHPDDLVERARHHPDHPAVRPEPRRSTARPATCWRRSTPRARICRAGIPYPPTIRKVNPADTPILVLAPHLGHAAADHGRRLSPKTSCCRRSRRSPASA